MFFIWLADKLGFASLTNQTTFVMMTVFFVTYINYGLIYLAAGKDYRHAAFKPLNVIFQGLYPDFNALWFNDFGVIICRIMLSNMYWPILE